jgi:hypothetical protein
MKVTLLGSGGNTPTPLPTCQCRICTKAREKGGEHVRRGNSTYVHEAKAMVDTPGLAFENLNQEGIEEVDPLDFSRFHPNHKLGLEYSGGQLLIDLNDEYITEEHCYCPLCMPGESLVVSGRLSRALV